MSKWVQKVYTANDTLVAPAGVTKMILFGCGGGQGGVGGTNGFGSNGSSGGYGGICSPYIQFIVDVVPNTSYSITIGAGSSGTAGALSPTTPANGGDTSFGALAVFKGATGSGPNSFGAVPMNIDASLPFVTGYDTNRWSTAISGSPFGNGNFGYAGALGVTAARGTQTTATANGGQGGVGSNGFWGIGGASGNGGINTVSAGTAGANPPGTSYGAGGGGGGGGAASVAHRPAGAGGNGTGGILIVMWVE